MLVTLTSKRTASVGKANAASNTLPINSTCYYNKQLFRTGAFADCTIRCQGRSWPAHRNVLSPRCDFFKCCFDGRFEEAGTRSIGMEDDDATAVEGLLYYLYTLDYPVEVFEKRLGCDQGSGSDSGIEDEDHPIQDAEVYWCFDLLMYKVADKYGLTELRVLAAQSLLDKAELAAKEPGQLMRNLDGFVSLIDDLYAAEDIPEHLSQLRTQIVTSMCEPVTANIRDQRMSTLVADVPHFAVELVEVLGKKQEDREIKQQEEKRRQKAMRVRLSHIPMNDESDCEE